MRKNMHRVFSSSIGWIWALLGFTFLLGIFFYVTEYQFLWWNDRILFYAEIFTQILVLIFFSMLMGALFYKKKYFSTLDKKNTFFGFFWGFLSFFLTGCVSCTVSIATYVGLGSILFLLPFHGFEIRILAVFLLFFSVRSTFKSLDICTIKNK